MESTKKVWTLTKNYAFLAKVSNDIKDKNNEIRRIDGKINSLLQRRDTLRRRLSNCERCKKRVLAYIKDMRDGRIEVKKVETSRVIAEVY